MMWPPSPSSRGGAVIWAPCFLLQFLSLALLGGLSLDDSRVREQGALDIQKVMQKPLRNELALALS